MLQYVIPGIPLRRLPAILRIALTGAVFAGLYGAAHDQVTYAISPEYFTNMKFHQFAWADRGWPPRVFAGVIGFLATWWIGFIAGWFLARAGLDEFLAPGRPGVVRNAFAIAVGIAAAAALAGGGLGVAASRLGDLGSWEPWRHGLALQDVRGFIIVAYVHAAGYVGALIGLLAAIRYVRCRASGTILGG